MTVVDCPEVTRSVDRTFQAQLLITNYKLLCFGCSFRSVFKLTII